jgi:hypothetical protein
MKKAHFKIVARLDRSVPQSGTVTIERAVGLFTVRPARRRRAYVLPLATVAEIVVARIIRAEVAAAKADRKKGGASAPRRTQR